MKLNKLPLLLATMLCCLPAISHAQLTRTWVSGVGDDANPGSRTAPCKTFAGAISKTATNGVIDVLDPGGFGAVTITKSITIEGDAAEGSILVSGTSGIIIAANTNDVVILRNLTIEGLNTGLAGIKIFSAGAVYVENCRINGFIASGIDYVNTATSAQLFVKDTTIHLCSPAGIFLAPSSAATVLIEQTSITACGDGVNANASITAVIAQTTASGNGGSGFLVGTNAHVSINGCTVVDNSIGIQSAGQTTLSDTTVANNAGAGLKRVGPGKIRTYHNNHVFGNSPDGSANSIVTSK